MLEGTVNDLYRASAGPVSESGAWVEVVTSKDALATFSTRWEELAQAALEPNVFYEPWQVLSAISTVATTYISLYVFVFHEANLPGEEPILIGFFPWHYGKKLRGLHLSVLSAWSHEFAPLTTPLIRKGYAHAAWREILNWATAHVSGRPLEFTSMLAEGALYQALVDVLRERRQLCHTFETHPRALYQPDRLVGIQYWNTHVSSGVRKELRRQHRRLADHGDVCIQTIQPENCVDDWVDQFLALENKSWKGAAGTAMAADANASSYFRAICREAHGRSRLHMLALTQAGQPVAMKCNFLAAPGSFALKIAYDPKFAKFSPGSQLEMANIIDLAGRQEILWMDSCAVPNHPMINLLWGQRRTISHIVISPGGVLAKALVGSLPCLRAIKRMMHRFQYRGVGRNVAP